MPELPDLEVFKANLKRQILDKKITDCRVLNAKALKNCDKRRFKNSVKGQKLTGVDRRGKTLIFSLFAKRGFKPPGLNRIKQHQQGTSRRTSSKIVLHLMLHGHIKYGKDLKKEKSTNILFQFQDKMLMAFCDPTRWMKIELIVDGDLEKSLLLKGLGVEPLSKKFTKNFFHDLLKKKRLGQIKPLLMNQKKIAGIGNAYTDEILFDAGIAPRRTASLLKDKEVDKLYKSIKKILKWGIKMSAKDVGEKMEESKREWMRVYRKGDQPCPKCGAEIVKDKVNNRDTFWCKRCQR